VNGQVNKKGSVLDWTIETLHCMQQTLYSTMPTDLHSMHMRIWKWEAGGKEGKDSQVNPLAWK